MNVSFLVLEDVSQVPFPEEVKGLVQNIKWSEYFWHASGLPDSLAKYSFNGNTLYQDELPVGTPHVEKQNFTGEIAIASYFVDENKDGTNYMLVFIITVVKGELLEIKLGSAEPSSSAEYIARLNQMQTNAMAAIKTTQAWWYRWLYKPYFLLLRGMMNAVIILLEIFAWIIYKVVTFLTPL